MSNASAAIGKRPRRNRLDWLVPAVISGSLVPYVFLVIQAWRGALGANPIATGLNQLGLLALVFLLASLSCTPLKIIFGWKWPLRLRKTLGLFGFFTALAHFLVYLLLDQVLVLSAVIDDIIKRPFITVGLGALVLLTPLALTSTKSALKRLGPKTWQRLHRLAYVAAALGVVHYFLRVKKDTTEPLIYAVLLMLMLATRGYAWLKKRQSTNAASPTP